MHDYDNFKLQVEALSGGKNTVILDNIQMPSIMVRIPKFKIVDVIEDGPDTVHPAFIINDIERDCIYISKYQNVIENDRAYSLPGRDPSVFMTYDQARMYCSNKGKGWHLMTNTEWSAIALWSLKNQTLPRGNNNHGSAHNAPHERGLVTYTHQDKDCRVGSGTGPASWSHDGTNEGIFDLNGNVWEFVTGVRALDGALHIIRNNNSAMSINQSMDSKLWRSISKNGKLMSTNNKHGLVYDGIDFNEDQVGKAVFDTKISYEPRSILFNAYKDLTANDAVDLTLLKTLCLYPISGIGTEDAFWVNTSGERIAIRGGYWVNGSQAGVFALGFGLNREESYYDVGCRCCYFE